MHMHAQPASSSLIKHRKQDSFQRPDTVYNVIFMCFLVTKRYYCMIIIKEMYMAYKPVSVHNGPYF